MSDPTLFVAGLLTTGPLVAPPPPALLLGWQQVITTLWAVAQPEAAPADPEPAPEFSPHPPERPIERLIEPLDVSLAEPVSLGRAPRSGAQLYQQRRAALAAGRLYTHLPGDSFAAAWEAATQPPTHEQWQQLLRHEAQAIAQGQGDNRLTVLLGDSLSQWFPSQGLPRGSFWLNQGISGENSHQVRQRLRALQSTRPSTIYLMVGINDLRQGAEDATILANLRAIAQELRQQHPEAVIVLQSLLPTRWPSLGRERLEPLNRAIRQVAQAEGLVYLHLYPLFTDTDGQLRSELTTDGLHLSPQGYQVWQAALQAAEQQLYPASVIARR